MDSSTASSAEAITIAFHGRPETRFFGTRTAGKSTAVQPFKLDDGAELYLTTAIDADRSGKSYPDGFTPDQIVPSTAARCRRRATTRSYWPRKRGWWQVPRR